MTLNDTFAHTVSSWKLDGFGQNLAERRTRLRTSEPVTFSAESLQEPRRSWQNTKLCFHAAVWSLSLYRFPLSLAGIHEFCPHKSSGSDILIFSTLRCRFSQNHTFCRLWVHSVSGGYSAGNMFFVHSDSFCLVEDMTMM